MQRRLLCGGHGLHCEKFSIHSSLPVGKPEVYPLSCGRQRPNTCLILSEGAMATTIATTITALQAQAKANLFLSDHLPDRFMAGSPSLNLAGQVWRVPVLLAYPIIGPVGQTGEILVNVTAAEVVSYTAIEEMKVAARALYEQHRNAIEAAVP